MNSFFQGNVILSVLGVLTSYFSANSQSAPNVIFVLADEWRAQDLGYNGNTEVKTPNLDRLAGESFNLFNTVSCCPVSCPYRASLLTGQYPLSTGVFMNDVQLAPESVTLSKVFRAAGYQTAYIGKWHLDGHGRSSFIPVDRRQGFEYWKVLECTHDYYNSVYWDNQDVSRKWRGYDAYAQTDDAVKYINKSGKNDKPFFMILSWGPPHTPFETAPENCKALYRDSELTLRTNVPTGDSEKCRKNLVGYYGHITALDSCIGILQSAVKRAGIEENTIFIFTSDHGAMVNSHGFMHKQQPYEESVNVPCLIKYPALFGSEGKSMGMLFNTPDFMPTILGLCGLAIPQTVQGIDKSGVLSGMEADSYEELLIASYQPFGQWSRNMGGKEYRGLRTRQYTYVSDLNGPWLLFDNKADNYQLNNLINQTAYSGIQKNLENRLTLLLEKLNDDFLPGMVYVNKWGYVVDETETVPYKNINYKGLSIPVMRQDTALVH